MKRVREIVLGCFLAVFAPRDRQPLGEWMAKNIIIRPQENPSKPGSYDPEYTPAIARLLDLFFDGTGTWRELIGEKSSQCSMSFHVLGHLVRMIKQDPANVMYLMDSGKNARKISERLQAFLQDSPATASMWVECEDSITMETFRLPGMDLWLAGAGSAGQISSSTVMGGVADEVDKHKPLKGEPPTLDLLRARLKEQTGSWMIAFSTPTLVSGQIHCEFLTGSQHRYFVPCPHCSAMQTLDFEQVRFSHCKDLLGEGWDQHRVILETFYECSNGECKGEIYDRHKRWMVLRGEWRPTNFQKVTLADGSIELRPAWEPGKLSAHYSDLYSQNENASFGQLAKKFIQALADPGKMRDFNQNHLGKPDEDGSADVTDDKILALRGPYKRQQGKQLRNALGIEVETDVVDPGSPLPLADPLFAGVLADTQDANSKWTIQVFARNGDQYVVDWGECLELADLDELLNRDIVCADGLIIRPCVVMIDEGGHRTFEVREHVYQRFPSTLSSRGSPGTGIASVALRDYRIDKTKGSLTVPVVVYDDATFRRDLYIRKIARFDREKFEAYGYPRLWLPMNLETKFTDELKRQKLIREPSGRLKWDPEVKGDDWGDTLKMGGILFAHLGPEILKAEAADRMAGAV